MEFTCKKMDVSRVGLVWENTMRLMPFGETRYKGSRWLTQEFVNLIELNPGIIIDLITCNLSSDDFIEEINGLKKLYPNVTIEYSLDETGILPGNWILESSGVDIKGIYFTEKIDNWRHTLVYIPYTSIFNKKPIKFNTPSTIKNITNSGYTDSDISNVVNIFSTYFAFAALKSNGSVVTWGDAGSGGDSSSVSAGLSSGVVNIFSTYSAFAALKSNGSVVTWGYSGSGGNSSSVSAGLNSGVVNIFSTGSAFAALKSNGSVVTWGSSGSGGDSSSVSAGLSSGVVNIFSTDYAFAALKSNGSVVTWGSSGSGGDSSSVSAGITYAYGFYSNLVYVSSPQSIPQTPLFVSKSSGILNILQKDLMTANITSYEYKIDVIKSYEYIKNSENSYEIDISLGWSILDWSTNKITHLLSNKDYFIKLRARNSTAPSDYNSFLASSNPIGEILLVINTVVLSTGTASAISSICFPAGTLIDTDQGKICIELIDKNLNTIRGNKIVGITETVSMLSYLVYIEKNALGKNIPSIKTIISPNHKLLYNREMVESRYLLEIDVEGVIAVKYSGEILYNVLLERHEKMIVNNLIVETLDPSNVIAQMYSKKFNNEKREYLIKTWNNFMNTKSEKEYIELSKYLY